MGAMGVLVRQRQRLGGDDAVLSLEDLKLVRHPGCVLAMVLAGFFAGAVSSGALAAAFFFVFFGAGLAFFVSLMICTGGGISPIFWMSLYQSGAGSWR